MLDGVAAGDDGVLLPFAAVDVAAGLMAEPMRFVDQRLQDRHRIGHLVLGLAGGGEGVGARREQLDPIRAVLDLLAHGGARFFDRANDGAGQWIRPERRVGGLSPQTMPRPDT